MNRRTYRFGESSLTLEFGDLITSDADVLVSSDDYMLTMGGGVSAAIRRAGGEGVIVDASKKVPAKLGDVVVTTAGALPAKHIFHAITIGRRGSEKDAKTIIERTTSRCFGLLDALGLDTIAFPAIGAGTAGFSYEDVAVYMADVIADDLQSRQRPIQATIYLYDPFRLKSPLDFIRFFEEFASKTRSLSDQHIKEQARAVEAEAPSGQAAASLGESAQDTDVAQRHQSTQRLISLGQERDELESKLVVYEGALGKGEIQSIEERLAQIHRLRLQALSELQRSSEKGVEIFISYAHEDEELRIALGKHLAALERQGLITAWHDRMITAGREWKGEIDRSLDSARVVLLLVSADFVYSDYCYDVEMKRAMQRHEQRESLVIPIILRPVVWEDAPFSKLQALPRDARAVTDWTNEDSAFVDITKGVRAAIEDLLRNA